MSANDEALPFLITSDEEMKEAVWTETGYEDMPDELPSTVLDALLKSGKRQFYTKYGQTNWYEDIGASMILLGHLCIKSKVRLENYSVASYTLGNESVDARDSDGESIQMTQFEKLVSLGKQRMGTDPSEGDGSVSGPTLRSTTDYMGNTGWRNR